MRSSVGNDTPAKIAFYATGNEVLGDSILDLNSGVAGVFTEVRANNAIAYVSPSFWLQRGRCGSR